MRPASVFLIVAVTVTATGPALSQSRALGASDARSIAETLGTCPAELLRAAWFEIDALEAAAVEEEVLRYCTARAEAISEFLLTYGQLEEAVANHLSPVAPPPPVFPDPPAALPDPMPPELVTTPLAETIDQLIEATPLIEDIGTAEIVESPPEMRWHVLFTARAGDGGWRAGLQRSDRIRVEQETVISEEGGTTAVDAIFEWVRDSSPPLIVSAGDRLPNGFEVVRVAAEVVQVRPQGGGSGADLPWVEAGDPSAPGQSQWSFTMPDGAGEGTP